MASKDHFLSEVPDYQPWYKKWLNKIRSSNKRKKSPDTAGPQTPGHQGVDQNARMQQQDNDQNFWFWHHHQHYLIEQQLSPLSQRPPALSSPEPNQIAGLKDADQSGFVETAGIQQPNVSDCNNVPDSSVLTPSQDFYMENTGRDYCGSGVGDFHQTTETGTYHYTDSTHDFYSDSYCCDSFASTD